MKMTRISPLLACGIAALAACSTPLVPQAENGFPNAPKLTAIYAIDNVSPNVYCDLTNLGGCAPALPDVLLYSTNAADQAKASKAPSSYGAFRVEFDSPLSGASIANNNDLSSFCSPMTGGPVALKDVAGGYALASSVCYDSTSALGQNPHVIIIPGSGTAFSSTATNPFTCHDFTPDLGTTPSQNRNILKPNTQYSITVASSVQGANSKPIDGAGTPITFNTAPFELMAVGYQDQNTGYLNWLDKPYAGFMKDLAADPNYQQPSDDTAMLFIFTEAVDPSHMDITVTRDDGSTLDGYTDFFDFALGGETSSRFPKTYERRAIGLFPGFYWEPGTKYKVTIAPTVAARNGDVLTASQAKTYTITSTSGSFAKRLTAPGSNATAVSVRPSGLNVNANSISVVFTAPLDQSLVNNQHFSLKDAAGTAVSISPSDISVTGGFGADFEWVDVILNPPSGQLSPLLPATTYTLSWTGLKTAPVCTSVNPNTPPECVPSYLAAKPVTDGSLTFTTATFRTADVQYGGSTINNAGTAPVDAPVTGTDVIFTDAPSQTAGEAPDTSTMRFLEVKQDGTTTPVAFTVTAPSSTATGSAARKYTLQASDANYTLKFGQAYRIEALTAIKNRPPPAANGVNLKAEGCTSADCRDVRAFTTRKWIPSSFTASYSEVGKGNPPGTVTPATMKLSFSSSLPPIDSATTNIANNFHLYQLNDDGTRGAEQFTGQWTCAVSGGSITCTSPSGTALAGNKNYQGVVTFPKTAPLLPASTFHSHPVDRDINSPTGGAWFGTLSSTFVSPCP